MSKSTTKEIVAEIVSKYAARESKVTSLSFTRGSLTSKQWVNPLLRKLNNLFKIFKVRFSFSKYEATIYAYSSKKDDELYDQYREDDLMINFGSGAFMHPRWINYDFPGKSNAYKKMQGEEGKDFIAVDLTKDIPLNIESGTVSLIYCSHTIEHLPESTAKVFLSECSRLLKSGGCLRLVFPNVISDYQFAEICSRQPNIQQETKTESIVAAAYNSFSPSSDYTVEELLDIFKQENCSGDKIPPILRIKDALKGSFRPGNPDYHLSFWNHNKLLEMSTTCGFDIYLPGQRGKTTFKPFLNTCVFDTTEPQYSLYGELVKL